MTPWYKLWNHQIDIAMGAPEVIARRVAQMYEPKTMWSTDQWLESQRMVLEKWEAAWRAWWATYGGSSLPRLASAAHVRLDTAFQPASGDPRRTQYQSGPRPVSSRVKANAKRLRSKRKA